MAKISLLLFVVVLFASLQVYEAQRMRKFNEALEKDLQKAEAMIEEDLKAKKINIEGLKSEVNTLSKSEQKLTQVGNDLAPHGKKLRKFVRANVKKAPAKNKKSVSVIQSILKDFGLNGGKE